MPLDNSIFRAPAKEMLPYLSICSEGKERQGKTHFAYSAPGPIGAIVLDRNNENVAIKAQREGRDIRIADFTQGKWVAPLVGKPNANFHIERWKAIHDACLMLANDKQIRSIVIDTGTQLYEDIRMAMLGKLVQVMPHQYGPVNDAMRSLIQTLNTSGKHIIITHKIDKEYKNDKWDGKSYERKGWKDMSFQCQMALRHECEMLREQQDDGSVNVRPQFLTRIIDCNQNPMLKGMELLDDNSTFLEVALLVYPEADPSLFVD